MAARANTVSNMDPYKVPWFADCAPSLLTNRTIRRYLSAYSQHTWPEVIKLTLIYGVLGLEQQFSGANLSIPQLRQLVEKGGAQLVVERNLPGLQRQILNLQTNLDAVFDRLAVEPPPASAQAPSAVLQPAQLARRQQQQSPPRKQQQQEACLEVASRGRPVGSRRPVSTLNPGPVAPKPSDNWRQGEATGFPSPPRERDHPLRRSLDNQGATNPIYPDWWLAAGPPDPPAPKRMPQKATRKQPRLAYSVQQQQQPEPCAAAADDLVTAEYLMVPGSGYGQGPGQPVVAGEGPPAMLTSITAHSIHTNPLYADKPQDPAGAAAPTGPATAADGTAAANRAQRAAGKGPRQRQAVQSKIREAVAASRQKAAAQQQRRQRLLASAVAAGSSLFGSSGPSAGHRASSTAAEAVAACAPAAAAEQFLSNPWTSWFMEPSAVKADVVGFDSLPAADITADDEARLGALAAGASLGEVQELRAPAAFAALQARAAAGQSATAPAAYAALKSMSAELAAGAVDADVSSSWRPSLRQQYEDDVLQEAAAEPWLLQQEQQGLTGHVGSSKGAVAVGADEAAACSSRGVFADITSGLNSQGHSTHRPYSTAGAGTAAGAGLSSAGLQPGAQPSHLPLTAGSASSEHQSEAGPEDWQKLPLIGEPDELQHELQEQQHGRQQRKAAWACDFGHLEAVEPPQPAPAPQQHRPLGKPRCRWSDKWVGDFGHLENYPRFARETAFQQQQPHSSVKEATGGPGSGADTALTGRFFMSPADLQQLVAAAGQLRDRQLAPTHPAGAAGNSSAEAEAACAEGTERVEGWHQEGETYSCPPAADAGPGAAAAVLRSGGSVGSNAAAAAGSPSAQGLAARLAELLSRWDAQAADSAGELPAGVSGRSSVTRTPADRGERAVAAPAVATAGPEGAASGPGAGHDAAAGDSVPETTWPATADSAVGMMSGLQDNDRQPTHPADAQPVAAAGDAAALLEDLQQAVSELSAGTTSEADYGNRAAAAAGSVAWQAGLLSSAEGGHVVDDDASSPVTEPAEGHLEGMQEASQMLQQALSRHDALMQLIASLGAAPGSELLASTASGSEAAL